MLKRFVVGNLTVTNSRDWFDLHFGHITYEKSVCTLRYLNSRMTTRYVYPGHRHVSDCRQRQHYFFGTKSRQKINRKIVRLQATVFGRYIYFLVRLYFLQEQGAVTRKSYISVALHKLRTRVHCFVWLHSGLLRQVVDVT
jgi:hypothetical protein